MTDIMVACIAAGSSILVGLMTLIGVVITNSKSNSKIEKQLEISQAVTETEIKELTREVRKHNHFAERMPVVEEQIKVINHRVKDIEDELHRS